MIGFKLDFNYWLIWKTILSLNSKLDCLLFEVLFNVKTIPENRDRSVKILSSVYKSFGHKMTTFSIRGSFWAIKHFQNATEFLVNFHARMHIIRCNLFRPAVKFLKLDFQQQQFYLIVHIEWISRDRLLRTGGATFNRIFMVVSSVIKGIVNSNDISKSEVRGQWMTEDRIGARLPLLPRLSPISFGTCWRDEIILISVNVTPPLSYHVIQNFSNLKSYLYYSLLLNKPPTYFKLKRPEAVNLPFINHVLLWDSVFNSIKQIGLELSVVLVSKVCVTCDISRWYAAIYFRACGFALNSVCTLWQSMNHAHRFYNVSCPKNYSWIQDFMPSGPGCLKMDIDMHRINHYPVYRVVVFLTLVPWIMIYSLDGIIYALNSRY